MVSSAEYIDRLHTVVSRLHRCGSVHRNTVPVQLANGDEILWKGEVEVFDLLGHPKAKRCFAWAYRTARSDKSGDTERAIAILDIPPIDSPQAAVRAALSAAQRQ